MRKKGFTIVEMLVVITIIGLLAGMIVVATMSSKKTARDARRKADLTSMKTALTLYFDKNKSYPSTCAGGTATCAVASARWCGEPTSSWKDDTTIPAACDYTVTGYSGATAYISNLAPEFLASLPREPSGASGNKTYLYRSDGSHYKVLSYTAVEQTPVNANDPFYDSARTTSYQVFSDSTSAAW